MGTSVPSSKTDRLTRVWIAVALCLAAWAPDGSYGETQGPVHTAGRWLVDGSGRVVVLHGVNIVPLDESEPTRLDIGDEDIRLLASNGVNTVRLGVLYSLVKTQPNTFDDAYIERIADLQRQFAQAGFQVLIDFHQDAFDRGMPDWTTDTDGLPFTPIHPLFDPARNRAWDNFWANAPAPDGAPMWDHYAGALARVAGRFRDAPGVLGYDLMNEPWPGSRWPTCVNPTGFVGRRIGQEDAYPLSAGCPPGGFDQTDLTEFMRRMASAVREADPGHALFVEPNLLFDFGPNTGLGAIEDRNVVFSFHAYCFANVASFSFGFTPPDDPEELCREQEGLVFNNAESYASRSETALMLTEFGSTGDPAAVRRTVELADARGLSWQYWAYFDATYSSPGNILRDPEQPRTGENINWDVLDVLIRPHPQVIAGTPLSYGFDAETRVFTLQYSTERVDGTGIFPSDAITEIFVPARRYPDGYTVTVEGAEVLPSADPQRLHLGNTTGTEVSVRVEPGPD